ncbi:MAG: filamentous hemagglutinin N-terminal domain-containing protein, partial [Rhodocyclaceae bacterium]|nr:filamentous hemagglutinin N-terminal domain-containing protein [Rhodocyclaceae bacterium]
MRHSSQPPAFLRNLKRTALGLALAAALVPIAPVILANPVAPTVTSGSATFSAAGSTLTVTNTPGTIINWQQFNIGQSEITKFIQQNAQSTVLNRITGQDPSQILGTLQSNGRVFLVNPNGILFGQNAIIDVAGLVASNLNFADADFLANRFSFSGGGLGAVINQGAITTPVGGSVYLIGSQVRNEGIITSPKGEVLLAAGNSVQLADTGTPSMSVTLTASDNQAINLGTITTEGGRIDIYGALIDQQGVLRADSASVDEQGRIILKATGTTTVSGTISATHSAGQGGTVQVLGSEVSLASTAQIDVSGATGGGTVLIGGDYQGKNAAIQNAATTTLAAGAVIKADALDNGNGGRVIVWADDKTFYDGFISARGGANGGDGGFVETSGHSLSVTSGRVDTQAPRGNTGMWLLDPAGICISNTACTTPLLGFAVTYDMTVNSAALDTALTASNVTLSATDFLVYELPAYTVPGGVPAGRSLDLYAPYMSINGGFSASQTFWMKLRTIGQGTSATLGVANSGRIDFGAAAALNFSGGGGIRIEADNSTLSVNIATGASANVGTGQIGLYARVINTVGGNSFTAKEMEIETDKIVGTLTINADYLRVVPWQYFTGGTKNVYVGLPNTDPRCATALCVFNQLAGTGVTDGLEIAASTDLYVEGSFSNPAKRLALIADHGTLYLNAPLSVTGLASEPVATLLGAHTAFINTAGPNAITTSNGRWVIIAPNQASLTAGGLIAASQLALANIFDVDYATEDAFWDALMAALNPAATLGNVFGYWNVQVLDPCQVNPISCAPKKPDEPIVVDDVVKGDEDDAKGVITYDPKLKGAGKGNEKLAKAAKQKAEAGVKKAKAEEKKAGAEAEKAKEKAKKAEEKAEKAEAEAKKTEAEAKKAEAQAKKTEAEAKKTEAEAKKTGGEAKKAEAQAKKAEAEAKKAEAEAKKAEAEKTKTEAEAKKAEAEKMKAEAEKKAGERREHAAKSFAKIAAANMSYEKLAVITAQRHDFKTETLAPALSILERNPKVADLPICAAGGGDVCVPAQRMVPLALPTPPTPVVSFLPQIQRKVAVVIGIDKYADPSVPPLESAVKDAQAIGGLLQEKFGYEVKVIPNATRADIVKGINAVSRGVGPDDSVTVYYAGHGYLMEKNNTGYWIPSDG